jgi:hypothetical protein
MCNLFSWIEDKNGKIWFNTDEDIEIAKMAFVDGIGHGAIEQIWKVSGQHKESLTKVPLELADAVNRSKCVKMAEAGRAKGIHYNSKGEIDAPWWPTALIEEARTLKYFDNHAEPLPEWKLFDTRRDAREAARDAPLEAAWEGAWNVAWEAAREAAREADWGAAEITAEAAAWDAALKAAWDAALKAARGAAREAARGAAWGAALEDARGAAGEAARDAALLACCYVAFYNKPRNKHLRHAKKRWEVYQRGYGCYYDIGGVLYCYKRP